MAQITRFVYSWSLTINQSSRMSPETLVSPAGAMRNESNGRQSVEMAGLEACLGKGMSYTLNRHTHTLLLALAIAVTSGCKIVIDVPEGGSVVTESGNYSCAAAESCEVDVDDDQFDETFIAIPAADYEFKGWKQRQPGLCQSELERLAPCTFTTAGYGLNPGLLTLLQEDIPIYLEPEFAPSATTEILFPSENSSSTDQFVTVRGIASDPDGIVSITVNGARASITPMEGAQTVESGLYTEVSWRLPLNLQTGTNTVFVGVEDGRGNVNPIADTAAIQSARVPTQFVLDEINNRLIGTVSGSGFLPQLTSIDLARGSQTLLSDRFFAPPPHCYQADTGEFFYLTFGSDPLELRSLNTRTLVDTRWMTVTVDPESEGFAPGAFFWDLVCASGHEDVYLLYSFSDAPQDNLLNLTNSRIVKLDLGANEVRMLEEFDTRAGDASILGGAKLMGDQLVVYPALAGPLFSIDTDSGERTQLPVRELSVEELVTDAANNKLYIVNSTAIYEVDLESGRDSILSFVQDDSPFTLPQVTEAVLDADNFRILIGDVQLDMILQVSLVSGERREFFSRRQGEGVSIVFGRRLYLTSDKRSAYVLDDGGNVTERLLEIDLASGDRREIGTFFQQFNEQATGLAVDEESGLAYAAFENSVYEVDLETEEVVQLTANSAAFGPVLQGISDLALDKAGNRLLLSDSVEEAVIALDLRTHVRTVLSQGRTHGVGDDFAGINALAFDAENNRLYAANQQSANIMSIDMETGDRTVILDACFDASGQDKLGNQQDLLYRDGELLILDDGLKHFSLDSEQCTVLRDSIPLDVSVLSIQWMNEEILLTSGVGGVGLFDTVTGEYVRVSE